MSKHKSYISVHSVHSSEAGGKEIAVLNLVANFGCRLLWNAKDTKIFGWYVLAQSQKLQQGTGLCNLNPDGIPSHSPGLRTQPRVMDKKTIQPQRGCGMNTGRLAAYEIRLFFKRRYATTWILSCTPVG
jgi:hypothetical protein